MRKNSSRNKKTHADLNFWAVDLNVVDNLMAYNLWKFQIDSFKSEA